MCEGIFIVFIQPDVARPFIMVLTIAVQYSPYIFLADFWSKIDMTADECCICVVLIATSAKVHHVMRDAFGYIWGFHKWRYPQNGLFVMENPWTIWGYRHFRKPPIKSRDWSLRHAQGAGCGMKYWPLARKWRLASRAFHCDTICPKCQLATENPCWQVVIWKQGNFQTQAQVSEESSRLVFLYHLALPCSIHVEAIAL